MARIIERKSSFESKTTLSSESLIVVVYIGAEAMIPDPSYIYMGWIENPMHMNRD